MAAGVAYSEDGVARGAMGVDAADYDRSGRPHLLVGNFSNQMLGLYHNEGKTCSWTRRRDPRSAAPACCRWPSACSSSTTISTAARTSSRRTATSKRRSGACSRRCSTGSRRSCSATPDSEVRERERRAGRHRSTVPILARGAAYGDYDRDGDLDVLVHDNHGPAYLYRNDGGNANNLIGIRLVGLESNRDGIGAVVRVESQGGTQWSMVRSGSSYCSQSDLALTFGLEETPAYRVLPSSGRAAPGRNFRMSRRTSFSPSTKAAA